MKRAAILVLLAATTFTLHAQAPPSFAKGVLAFEKKEWANAEALMRDAVAGNPREVDGTVRISGEWFETYVPHYFLARALAKQGKCEEANREFAESERQGVTPAIADFARHLASRDGCAKSTAKPAKPKVITEVEVPFDEDAPTPAKPKPKPTSTTSTTPVEPKPKPQTKPVSTSPTIPNERELRARAERSIISDAVTAYLAGRYEETVRLASATFTDGAAAAQAALFRAAARYAQYRLGGEKDDALRGAMLSDVRRYRELRPNGNPDPRLFPPGFIALTQPR
jgi:hypothetical protein